MIMCFWGCSLSRCGDGGRSQALSVPTCGPCASQARASSTTSIAVSAQLVRGTHLQSFTAFWNFIPVCTLIDVGTKAGAKSGAAWLIVAP